MVLRVLALLLFALSLSAPGAGLSSPSSATASCCAQMESCGGHCQCAPKQTCSVSKPVAVDQQAVARAAQLSPRVDVELFSLSWDHQPARESERQVLSRVPESPPVDSPPPQALLCLWLI